MALEGTLRDFSFADILQLISLQRKTGVLTLKSEGNVVTISFLEGRIVGANSLNQHMEDRLGLILLKQGGLKESDLEAALRVQEETLQRLGRILIDRQVVPAERVRHALQQQILQIIYRVFRWSDGDYHFSQEIDIDYDRDLMSPMVADSIIMEGARMTDEWPFVNQRIPDRGIVFIKSNPVRKLEVAEADDDFDDLGFSFTDSPEERPPSDEGENRVTPNQMMLYEAVNGRDSVDEIILDSPLVEFETCKAIADLLDRKLVREATPEEVAQRLARSQVRDARPVSRGLGAVPWMAIPFLVLLGFSLTVMTRNPLNPAFGGRAALWNRYVLESSSWFRIQHIGEAAESSYYLTGVYPDSLQDLVEAGLVDRAAETDPWGNTYRLVVRGHKLLVTGSGSEGQPVPMLILSRSLAWEGGALTTIAAVNQPGVILLD